MEKVSYFSSSVVDSVYLRMLCIEKEPENAILQLWQSGIFTLVNLTK